MTRFLSTVPDQIYASGLGIVVEDSALKLLDQGAVIKDSQTGADSRA